MKTIHRAAALFLSLLMLCQLLPIAALAEGTAEYRGSSAVYSITFGEKTYLIPEGNTITEFPFEPEPEEGKVFLGWFDGDTKVELPFTPTRDMTLTAKFENAASLVRTLDFDMADGAVISLTGLFPEECDLTVTDTAAKRVMFKAMKAAGPDMSESNLYTYDIQLTNPDGSEYQPESGIPVKVTVRGQKFADALAEGRSIHLVHQLDDNTKEEITDLDVSRDTVSFEVDHFSSFIFTGKYDLVDWSTNLSAGSVDVSLSGTMPRGVEATAVEASQKVNVEVYTKGDPENGSAEVLAASEITLLNSGVEIEPSSWGGKALVTMSSDKLVKALGKGSIITVYHIDDAGVYTPLDNDKVTITDQGVSFEAEVFSVYAVVGTLEKYIQATDGHNYKVTVNYGADAGIPQGADLLVEEFTGVKQMYDEYVSYAENVLDKNEKISHARFFDIRIVKDGSIIQPKAPVEVTIELTDELPPDVKTIHFGKQPEKMDASVVQSQYWNGAVTFETSGFSVYGVVFTEIIRTDYLASNGALYDVTIRYNSDAQIPDGSRLRVTEIEPGTDQYQNAYKLVVGNEPDETVQMSAVDISIISPEGQEIEPRSTVTVELTLKKLPDGATAEELQENIKISHIKDTYTGIEVETVAAGSQVRINDGISSVFDVREFSTFTITYWFTDYTLDIAVVDTDGNSIGSNSSDTITTNTVTVADIAPAVSGYQFLKATIGGVNETEIKRIRYNNNNRWQYRTNASDSSWTNIGNNRVLFVYERSDPRVTISFNSNGGTGNAPGSISALPGDSITLPDYTGTRNGYTFLGWSTGTNLGDNGDSQIDYYPLYPAGSEYTVPDQNITLYAVWNTNTAATGEFYIRLDGRIPYEPGRYASSAYTNAIKITGAIIEHRWIIDNDATKPNNGINIVNNVTAKLNQVPTVDQIVANLNRSTSNLGFSVENRNGEVVVSDITNPTTNRNKYNLSEGDALYVLWYVQKKEKTWHVDGVLLVKNKVNIAYDGNAPGSVEDVPMGYQEIAGTVVTIGASGSKNGTVKTPRRPGYIFLGWNTKPDGSGTSYNNNDGYTLNEDTTLYAQWSKGTNMMTVTKTNEDGETLAGAQFKLEEKTSSGLYIEKANRTTGANGTFTYDQMENDTLYRMTETYAPNGYEIQNSFFFKVAVDSAGETELHLHVCDENGNFIAAPDWLNIQYIAADDPTAQGVARIRFNIRDERIRRSITFIKTDEQGNPLSGAEYTLTNSKGAVTGVLKDVSGSNGVFSVDNATLAYGSYTLTEETAPAKYKVGDPVTFTLNDYVSATNTGLTITGGNATATCQVSSVTEQGLTTTTYAYTVTVTDVEQPHIIVAKTISVDGDLDPNDLNTVIYYALTKNGEDAYVKKENGDIWIESMNIVDGVPTPAQVIFDGVDFGEYDVWELALINGEYTRMYNGLVVGGNFQLDSVSASSADGGNNAVVSENDLEAQVNFTNNYGRVSQSTSFVANKKWTERDGTFVNPPAGAAVTFTLYSEKKDASGNIINGTLREVRSIELDGIHDPEGEDTPWQAKFKYLPIYYEGNLEYSYKVKETVTMDGYYPNNYPQEYYLTSSGGAITNRKLTTDVELHKHFEIYPENADLLSSAQSLMFTLTGPGGTESYSLDDLTPSADDRYDYVRTLSNLPLGEYRLTESGQVNLFSSDGYELVYSVSSAEGESEVGDTEQPVLTLALENNYAKKGALTVKKNRIIYEAFEEQTAPAIISGKTFSFVVKRGNLYLQEDGTLGTNPYQFSLAEGESKQFNNIPAGQYTVTEQDASVDGYLWEVVDATQNTDGSYSKDITIEADNNGSASFDNHYTKIENGSLTVSKIVVGGPEEAGTKSYQVEITTKKHGETLWLDEDGSLKEEQVVLTVTQNRPLVFTTVTAGIYTVYEVDAAFKEYSLDVTYSEQAPVTIHKDEEKSVTITNTYTYQYTPVKITKTVTGNMADLNLYFGFDVYLTDEENQPIIVDGVTDSNGLIQFSLKDKQEKLLEKLPKGARLRIVEHNDEYVTTISGRIGVGDGETEETLETTQTQTDSETDTTATYIFTIPDTGATVDFTNDKSMTPDTGVHMDTIPYLLILALCALGLEALRRRRVKGGM